MTSDIQASEASVVIGAGIVGICTALYLQEAGRPVTLVDQQPPGEGTSFGNAGIIASGSVHPEAMPGFWKEIPGMMLNRLAPVSIRPAYVPRFLPWLLRFLARGTDAKAEQASIAISDLSKQAFDHLLPLVEAAGAQELIRRDGILHVYETEAQFKSAQRDCAYRDRRGIDYEVLNGEELRQMEPALRPGLAGGIHVPGAGHTVSPVDLSRALAELFQDRGGLFQLAKVTGFEIGAEGPRAVQFEAGSLACTEVFVTAGAFSKSLAKQLGSWVPLDTERGYHMMLPQPNLDVRKAMLFSGRGFGVTAMSGGLRLAGTVEFGGLEAEPNYARADALVKSASQMLPGLNAADGVPWMGYRPSVPDSIPVISRSPVYRNVYFGFGHGHLGLTQAAVTGRMLADMASGQAPPVDPTAYRIDRF
jgi:D-amino-acid dehydrogenase